MCKRVLHSLFEANGHYRKNDSEVRKSAQAGHEIVQGFHEAILQIQKALQGVERGINVSESIIVQIFTICGVLVGVVVGWALSEIKQRM